MTDPIYEETGRASDDMFYPRSSPFDAQLKKWHTLKRIEELIVPPFLSDDNGNRWANEQLGLLALYDRLTQIFLKSQPGFPYFIDLVKYFNELTLVSYQGAQARLNYQRLKELTVSVIDRFNASIERIYKEYPPERAENLIATAIRYSIDLEAGLKRFPIGGTRYTKILDGGDEPYELRRYAAVEREKGHVLLIYALVNKADILDYAPHLNKSVIQTLNQQGIAVYMLYWKEPQRDWELDDYYRWIRIAIQSVSAQIKRARVNCVGYCQGGALTLMTLNAQVIAPDRLRKLGLLASPIDTSSQGLGEDVLKHADVLTGQDIDSLHLGIKGKWPLAEGMNALVATAVAAWGRSNKGLLDGNVMSLYMLLRDPSIYAANTVGVFEELIDFLVNKPGIIEWAQKHAAGFSSPQVKERLDQLTSMLEAAIADGDMEKLYYAYPGIKTFVSKRSEHLHACLEILIGLLGTGDEEAIARATQAFIDRHPSADYLTQTEANERPAAFAEFILRRFPELREVAAQPCREPARLLAELAQNSNRLGTELSARQHRQFAVEVKGFLSGVTLRRWMWDTPDMALTAWVSFNQFLYLQNRFMEDPSVRQGLQKQLTELDLGMIVGTKDDVVPPSSSAALLTIADKQVVTFIADRGHVALVMSAGVLNSVWSKVGTWLLAKPDHRSAC